MPGCPRRRLASAGVDRFQRWRPFTSVVRQPIWPFMMRDYDLHQGRTGRAIAFTRGRSQPYTRRRLQAIHRALHAKPATVQHMRKHHRRADVRMPKQFLNRPDVTAGLELVRRK